MVRLSERLGQVGGTNAQSRHCSFPVRPPWGLHFDWPSLRNPEWKKPRLARQFLGQDRPWVYSPFDCLSLSLFPFSAGYQPASQHFQHITTLLHPRLLLFFSFCRLVRPEEGDIRFLHLLPRLMIPLSVCPLMVAVHDLLNPFPQCNLTSMPATLCI